jgi:hypothetical protein
MVNALSAIRRGLLITGLSVVLLTIVAMVTTIHRASGAVDSSLGGPSAGETWLPTPGTVFQFVSNEVPPQVVVQVTKVALNSFVTSTALVRAYKIGGGFTDYVPEVSLIDAGDTAVMTATGFALYGSGAQLQFRILMSGTFGSPELAQASYTISATYHTYVPDVIYDAATNLGTDPCNAIVADPLVAYSIAQDSAYRFFSLTLPTTSTIYMTATNYPVNGQMQLRRPPTASCAPTGTVDYIDYVVLPAHPSLGVSSIPPGKYVARFNGDSGITSTVPFTFRWSYIPGAGLLESNNSPCNAWNVALNTTYAAHPEDFYDYYAFDNPVTGTVQITIANYTAAGQYQLIHQTGECNEFEYLLTAGSSAGTYTIPAKNRPPGRYYLAILTTGGYTTTKSYTFRITTPPVVSESWSGTNINTCYPFPSANQNCTDHQYNGVINVFWDGAGNATHMTATLVAQSALGSCASGPTPGTFHIAPVTTPYGVWQKTGIANGHYKLQLEISGPKGYRKRDFMPIKMNCDFATSAVEGTTATPVPGELEQMVPLVPIPAPVDALKPKPPPAP